MHGIRVQSYQEQQEGNIPESTLNHHPSLPQSRFPVSRFVLYEQCKRGVKALGAQCFQGALRYRLLDTQEGHGANPDRR